MKKQFFLPFILITASMFLTSCNNHEKAGDNQVKTSAEINNNDEYQCVMKCEGDKTYEQPGQCPVCKMDLEPLEKNQ